MNDLEFDFGDCPDKNASDQPKPKTKGESKDKGPEVQSSNQAFNFEDSLKRLEAIVTEMEHGQLSLEQSMKHFEEGTKLANHCTAKLAETEKKVEMLLDKDKKEWQAWEDGNLDGGTR